MFWKFVRIFVYFLSSESDLIESVAVLVVKRVQNGPFYATMKGV